MLPYIQTTRSKTKRYTINFSGINLGNSIQDGEFCDTLNLSTSGYPCLTQREPREVISDLTSPTALYSNKKLMYVDGTSFYYDGVVKGQVTEGKKQFATIGANIVIFPDKKYYNETDDEFGSLEAEYTGSVTFTANSLTSSDANFSSLFSDGDGLTISGCTEVPENNKTIVVREVTADTLTFYDNSFTEGTETSITIKREVPDLEYICESNNRLWGVCNNTFYGSKLGSPKNFNVFDGLSDDSYQLACGTAGDFTGCIGYGSYVIFFKENYIHKLYGSKPSNYQIITSQAEGVQPGCEKSIAIINETIFYKSRNGIMAYTGSVPELISSAFGSVRFGDTIGGTDNSRYYVSMQRGESYELYAYDIVKNLWIKEDNTNVLDFTYFDGYLYFLDNDKLYRMGSGNEKVIWSGTLGDINETATEKKGCSKFTIRAEMEQGAYLNVEINPDYTGWVKVFTGYSQKKRVFIIPISPPTRCDSFKMRLSGEGKCIISALSREYLDLSEK